MSNGFLKFGEEDAIKTLKFIDDNPKYSTLYRKTNENLGEYFKSLEMEGKRILSVASTGDHYLTSLLFNPEEVVLYDINELTRYYSYLKIIAFCVLSPADFIAFFVKGRITYCKNDFYRTFFDHGIYLKFKSYLPQDVQNFWDYLYKKDSEFITGSHEENKLFFPIPKRANRDPMYIDGKNYKKLQRILEGKPLPEFHCFDIAEIDEQKLEPFDIILTSNISTYFYKSSKSQWVPFVINVLSKHLNRNGIIQSHYLWENEGEIFNRIYYNIPEIGFHSISFESSKQNGEKDTIMVYRNSYDRD